MMENCNLKSKHNNTFISPFVRESCSIVWLKRLSPRKGKMACIKGSDLEGCQVSSACGCRGNGTIRL